MSKAIFVRDEYKAQSLNKKIYTVKTDAIECLINMPATTIDPCCAIEVSSDCDYTRLLHILTNGEKTIGKAFKDENNGYKRPCFHNGSKCVFEIYKKERDYTCYYFTRTTIGGVTLDGEGEKVDVITLNDYSADEIITYTKDTVKALDAINRLMSLVKSSKDFQTFRHLPDDAEENCPIPELGKVLNEKMEELLNYICGVDLR